MKIPHHGDTVLTCTCEKAEAELLTSVKNHVKDTDRDTQLCHNIFVFETDFD